MRAPADIATYCDPEPLTSPVLNVIPVIGQAKGIAEAVVGCDIVTGEELGVWRWAGLVGLREWRLGAKAGRLWRGGRINWFAKEQGGGWIGGKWGSAAIRAGRVVALSDSQLDTNILIRLLRGDPEVVTFVQANRSAGLSYNVATRAEFLDKGTRAELRLLEQKYGIRLIREINPSQIDAVAQRLQQAFAHTERKLGTKDARVAATAYLKGEPLATGDLRFYKRALDLGLRIEFVGTGKAASLAAAYQPDLVTIPSP
jgi:predicted nucleic acid-binding protein